MTMTVATEPLADIPAPCPQRPFHEVRRMRLWRMANWQTGRGYRAAERALADNRTFAAVAIACFAFQAVLIWGHTAWLDEWQALLIAVQTPDIGTMLDQLHFEGHPPLWYLILRGVAAFAPLDAVLPLVNSAMAAALLWAVFSSRLPRATKIALALNELILFEYLTISRSLALGAALVFLTVRLWKSRAFWPLVALLALTDFFFGLISLFFVFMRLREGGLPALRRDGWGIALWLASSLASAVSVIPDPAAVTDEPRHVALTVMRLADYLGQLIFPFQADAIVPTWNGNSLLGLGVFLAPTAIYVCVKSLAQHRDQRWMMAALAAVIALFAFTIYPVYLRHTSLLALLLIALVWHNHDSGEAIPVPIRRWLVACGACGILTGAIAMVWTFDPADAAARSIQERGLADRQWVAHPDHHAVAVAGQAGMAFAGLERGCASTFMRWDLRSTLMEDRYTLAMMRRRLRQMGPYYLITDYFPHYRGLPYTLIERIAPGLDGKAYYLWKVGDGPVPKAHVPACVPGLLPVGQESR